MKEKIFDLIKWTVLILIAATFFHVVYAKENVDCKCKRYAISADDGAAFRIDQYTGEVWIITPGSIRSISEKR